MRTKVRKWGNSLGVRIPKAFAEEAAVGEGSTVDVSVAEGRIVVTPLAPRRYTLEKLLLGITPENRHAEIDSGTPRGREAW
jgi:antitoxin MazE